MEALDLALARLEDIPDQQLLEVSEQIQQDFRETAKRWEKCKAELTKRTQSTGATVIDAGDILLQIDWDREYDWDVDIVAQEAPAFVGWTKERVIPASRKVTNTRALNEHIKKLGKTAKAERLERARRVTQKNPKFQFLHPVSGEEDE